jgi:hypothetical protein
MLKYIELKTGYNDNGPAWIGRVRASKSGRTLYFNGRALKQEYAARLGTTSNLTTGEFFWVSDIKRNSQDAKPVDRT